MDQVQVVQVDLDVAILDQVEAKVENSCDYVYISTLPKVCLPV